MNTFLIVWGVTAGAVLIGALVMHLVPRISGSLGDALCRAPLLDIPITYFTVAPIIAGPIWAGWLGLAGAVAGQVSAVLLWGWLHELAHLRDARGPRIVTTMNSIVGRARNHAAVWLTAIVTPVFWVVRLAQVFIYPPITWLIGLPKYRQGDWVNVSRHKFSGLVGHDRIWCLYCDWMTGVWSLGSEMLRNVESFWCPIRFRSDLKCDNCRIDFPDIDNGWVPASGTMKQVTEVLEEKYRGRKDMPWFGHPVRLTVARTEPAAPPTRTEPRA
ncbi:MAG: hypothetical protein IT437_05375 [Phycisphaerales bacterium]|nr:hypothetical protein [Phycisphaerales bacterium]